jgi:hypothetical protein
MGDAMIMFGISSVFTVVTAIFWRWVTALSSARDKDSAKIDALTGELALLKAEVYRDYQSKSESHRDNAQIIDMLQEIKTNVTRLGDKIDQKADK